MLHDVKNQKQELLELAQRIIFGCSWKLSQGPCKSPFDEVESITLKNYAAKGTQEPGNDRLPPQQNFSSSLIAQFNLGDGSPARMLATIWKPGQCILAFSMFC